MAWIMKNSAGATVERRPEPYLDEALKAEIEKTVLPRYPTRRAATLPVLHAIQDKYNWVPLQAIEETAEFLGLKASEVADTASFYEMYWTRPKGKYLIMVCQSLSCELLGHHALIEKVKAKLGIEVGQTSADGKFTLMHAECLGSCGTAPAALINDKLYESLTPENLEKVLDALP
jgi:NADH-quinone oxidoreductase subunit E